MKLAKAIAKNFNNWRWWLGLVTAVPIMAALLLIQYTLSAIAAGSIWLVWVMDKRLKPISHAILAWVHRAK